MMRSSKGLPRLPLIATVVLAVTTPLLLTCTPTEDVCGNDPECDPGVGLRSFAVTCDPYLTVYPVFGAHNGGYDSNWDNFTCPPHPASSPDNSDFIAGDHYGNDIFAPRGTPVVAARAGTIVRAGDAGAGGNRVTVRDGCGWYYYYAHLNSITRWSGSVSPGTQIGTLGNTGAEWTAPHLHFSIYPDDCYSCGINPFPYLQDVDSTSCTGLCECREGETQDGACGNCGTRTRTCRSDCTWGAWSACRGEGPCSPGATQDRDCCDCGSERRTCRGDCAWGDWGACRGPDPGGGTQVCDTEEPGPCAEGRTRCVEGCLDCVRIYEPSAEICDDVDNDCSGETDDGLPREMGDPPPDHAALLVDVSFSHALAPGEISQAWASFENVGTRPWPAGDVWLGAATASEEGTSAFFVEGVWPAWDVAAVLEGDIDPGEIGLFEFEIRIPDDAGGEIVEDFQLMGPDGDFMRCPEPLITLSVAVIGGGPDGRTDGGTDGGDGTGSLTTGGGCSCTIVPH
jgi:hypothetical protein